MTLKWIDEKGPTSSIVCFGEKHLVKIKGRKRILTICKVAEHIKS